MSSAPKPPAVKSRPVAIKNSEQTQNRELPVVRQTLTKYQWVISVQNHELPRKARFVLHPETLNSKQTRTERAVNTTNLAHRCNNNVVFTQCFYENVQ